MSGPASGTLGRPTSGVHRTRVLVVGRSGQLATDLVEAAVQQAVHVTALGRPDLDLASAASLERAFALVKPDFVINAAAYTAVDKAETERDLAMVVNRNGPGDLAMACAQARVPLIHVSTDMVFPERPGRGFREDDPVGPVSHYGATKLAGEQRVAEAGGAALIARVSWIFGPSGDNFVKSVLRWANRPQPLSIVSDQVGRPTASPALAHALLKLGLRMATAQAASRPSGVLHLAGDDVMTRLKQAQLILAASRARGGPFADVTPVLTSAFPLPAKRTLNAVLDITRAQMVYGVSLGRFADHLDATLDRVIGPRLI
jgi:dTDP-4-dehydrorhamnose reductase